MASEVFYNYEAEAAVLAALMKKDFARKHYAEVAEEDFGDTDHRKLYTAIARVTMENKPVDFVLVSDALTKLYGNDTQMGLLVEITRTHIGAEFVFKEHVALLKGATRRRKLYKVLGDGMRLVEDAFMEPEDAICQIRDRMRGICEGKADGDVSLQTVLVNAYSELERRAKGESKGMPTGIRALDRVTSGFHRGEMTIVGARPAVGKSAFAAQAAISAAQAGARVCVCSREMTDVQYGIRMLVRGTNVPSNRLRSGELQDGDWEQLADSMMLYGDVNVRFLFAEKYAEDLRNQVRHMVENDGLDMLIVDYVQLMQTRRRFEKDYLRIGYVSKMLKDMSTDFNISVVALAQVGRSADGDMPSLSELRGSGDLEQDADNVIFLHRPEDAGDKWVRPDDKSLFGTLQSMNAQYIVLNIAKHRQGETCAVPVVFHPAEMRYTEISRRE